MDLVTKLEKQLNKCEAQFSKLPLYAQKILDLDVSFDGYSVSYEGSDFEQVNNFHAIIRQVLGVSVEVDDNLTFESCDSQLLACIVYLRDRLDEDDGYDCASVLHIDDLSNVTDEEFTDFCSWLNGRFPSWLDGIRQNPDLRRKLLV